eukprot:TRINITY_DN2111_c0_g5_i1.p1 TRINITY_DN2111_c0_g5~~TRINITY_DN2111_c0_g5_i1.p1  ORF type:complete len:1111 (+),score=357.90 TRINITY_DN2111_c0_g5_i1:44-3376(+)
MVAASLLLCTAALSASLDRKHINGDNWVQKTGGYKVKPSIPLHTDVPPKQRGTPPYVPPRDWIYNTTGGPVEGKINVHLVPHTHDDTGWQVTVDQYFYEEVYYILDTLVMRLQEDPNRKFMYVETGFFARWWDQQPPKKKALTKSLVESGQLEFINGGWCMHDEASPYYVEMIDQTTRGHQFLKKHFGSKGYPKGTWSIDPFGHSNTNAWLLGAESGMEYEFWGRMDYQDFNMRVNESRLEWIWQGSQSMGDSAQIFAGELFGGGHGGYGGWFGFDGNSPQVQDDPSRHDYNVDWYVDQFVQHARFQDKSFRTSHQIWAMGSDFNYQNADHWYHNLDKLIHYINQNGSVNAFYSTPTIYVNEKKKANLTWEVRQDDIFPLADADHHYWSGYFTSRPSLKRQVHVASNFLNAARQMEVVSGVTAQQVKTPTERPAPPVGPSWTDSLEGTVGVATHHDGMSGTERQDVSDDYEQRISESHGEVEAGVALSLNKLLGANASFEHCNCNSMGGQNCLNISMCALTTNEASFTVAAWNPLGRSSRQVITLPVTGAGWNVSVNGKAVLCQTTELDARTKGLPELYLNYYNMSASQAAAAKAALANKATHALSFAITIPAMGFSTVTALRQNNAKSHVKAVKAAPKKGSTISISNAKYELSFDTTTGTTTVLKNLVSNATTSLVTVIGWYNSSVGGCTTDPTTNPQHMCDGQRSGAYIFRSNSSDVFYPGPKVVPALNVVKGNLVQEVYQVFSPWATAVYRLWSGQAYVEVEWTVGPIPVETPWVPSVVPNMPNHWGKEVIVKYSSGLQSQGVFYTDSNAREMVKRQFNKRGPSYPPLVVNEPVAGNYYPVNAMISVQDTQHQLAVLTDVSQGGASLQDGAVELMVHRRLLADDNRGVQEPLNETMCGCNDINAQPGQMGEHGHLGDGGCWCEGLTMRGKHLLIFDTIEKVNEQRRQSMEELSFSATLAFSKGFPALGKKTESYLAQDLPASVKLLTLTNNYVDINTGKLLLRVAHLYSVGESSVYSVPVTVDFSAIFAKQGLTITAMEETQLTGTYSLTEMDNKKHKWETFDPTGGKVLEQLNEFKSFNKRYPFDVKAFSVVVRPMEVRTYLVNFS